MEREEGFYWALSHITGELTVVQYKRGKYWMFGCADAWEEADFSILGPVLDIGERKNV